MAEQSVTRSGKSSSQRRSEAQSVSRTGKGDLQTSVYGKTTTANPVGRRYGEKIGPQRPSGLRYAQPIGPSNKGSVPGGMGITALKSARMTPTSMAPKATPNIAPAAQVVSNVVRERVSPAPATKTAVAPKAKETAYQRQQRMVQQKMGVAGPRGGTSKASSAGGMRSTGGGSRSSGGGAVGSTSGTRGYSSGGNVGRGDVGAGRRGGGR
jgi:hypothetical protein